MTTLMECMRQAEARLEWAYTLKSNLRARSESFFATEPYTVEPVIASDVDVAPGLRKCVYKFVVRTPAPIELSLLAADTVHNLRALLDNLVWAAGVRYGANDLLAMPFYATRKQVNEYLRKKGATRLPEDIQSWIDSEQVYACNRHKAPLLHFLHRLWNYDKHRVPLLAIGGTGLESTYKGNVIFKHDEPIPRKHGDIVGHLTVSTDGPPGLEMRFCPVLVFVPQVDGRHLTPVDFLDDCHTYICNHVMPLFRQHLG
jgi:hypothetical protein